MYLRAKLTRVMILMLTLSVSGLGQANKLQDLINTRASSGESELESRGYVLTHSSKGDDRSWSYWWNSKDKKCVCVGTRDGRYVSIIDTLPGDCNQSEKQSNGSGTGTAVAIGATVGAAALIGALIAAHKAHNHDNQKHYDNSQQEAEYERGFRDGLYNNAFHDYSNTEYYRNGYQAGVDQRRQETSYASGYGGYRPYASVKDLVGARASSGESELQTRGFKNVDGFKSGNASYTIWFNNRTRQCIQVATVDGKYDSLTDIQTHPKCN